MAYHVINQEVEPGTALVEPPTGDIFRLKSDRVDPFSPFRYTSWADRDSDEVRWGPTTASAHTGGVGEGYREQRTLAARRSTSSAQPCRPSPTPSAQPSKLSCSALHA